jgi:hypothetical protein
MNESLTHTLAITLLLALVCRERDPGLRLCWVQGHCPDMAAVILR